MNYSSIVEQIQGLDAELKEWNHHYASLRAQLEQADSQIMALHKKKWQLELLLIPVQQIPTFKPKKTERKKEVEVIDIDKMTPQQLEQVLRLLRAQQKGTYDNEEE